MQMNLNWTDKTYVDDGSGIVVGNATATVDGGGVVGGASRAPVDDSLTSLNWLHNLNIMGEIQTTTPPTPPASPGPLGSSTSDSYGVGTEAGGLYGAGGTTATDLRGRFGTLNDAKNHVGNLAAAIMRPPMTTNSLMVSVGATSVTVSAGSRKNRAAVTACPLIVDDVDYKVNGDVKPPYSYATLICMAMKANKNKMSLSAIYKWIRDNFMYYRREDTGWQNSIRHNLSLNKCFIKVPRNKDEPGKGGFWRLDPKYAEEMADGTFKKRRMSNRPSAPKAPKVERHTTPPTVATTTTTTPKKDGGAGGIGATLAAAAAAQNRADPNAAHSYYLPPPPPPLPLPPQQMQSTSMSELEASLLPLTPLAPHLVPTSSRSSPLQLALVDDAETEAATSSLKGDFCWNSVLNEDIELDGLRYKTLDIVDMDVVSNDVPAYRYHRTTQQPQQSSPSSAGGGQQSQEQQQQQHQQQPQQHEQLMQSDGIGCLDSPALSLDADDLLVSSDTSNDDLSAADNLHDLTIHNSQQIGTQDWWRLTIAAVEGSLSGGSNCIAMTNLNANANGSVVTSHCPEYDVAEAVSDYFLGHAWDDAAAAARTVLPGPFDLDGLVDLDGY